MSKRYTELCVLYSDQRVLPDEDTWLMIDLWLKNMWRKHLR